MSARGRLIAFEGIDGTGKSTQISLLAEALRARGGDVLATREPTDGPYGQKIRALFRDRTQVSREEECQLFMSDRREHVRDVLLPALAAGKVVLTDRYYLSTAAYQGAAGLDVHEILRQNEAFAPSPDLAVLLTLPVDDALTRIRSGRGESPNSFEQEASLRRVAAIFDNMTFPFLRRIDGRGSVAAIHASILEIVESMLV